MVFDNQKNWASYLPLAEWWYNTTFHSATKLTPFGALYGYPPPQFSMSSAPKSVVESVNLLLKDRQQALSQLKANLAKAQNRIKQFADRKRSERSFEKGDWVYLKLQPYMQISVSGKGRIGEGQTVTPSVPLMGTYEFAPKIPQKILARKMVKRRNVAETQVLVQWQGLESEEATWEDYSFLAKEYPEFILEDEKAFKEGELSRFESNLGTNGAELGMNQIAVEEKEKGEELGSPSLELELLKMGSGQEKKGTVI
ncbi:uncharacterized protein LOC144564426 [Carex rostrata]